MASHTPDGKADKPARRMRGFEPAGGLVRGPVRSAGETRGFAVSRLLTHWDEIVGPDLAAIARPVKVSYAKGSFGATLTILVQGAHAPIVQMQEPKLRERVNACYGYAAVSRIVITQTSSSGFAEGQTPFSPKPPARACDPEAERRAQAMSHEVADPGLRAALATLAAKVLTRTSPEKG